MNRAECIAAKVGSLPAAAAHRLANIPFSSSGSTGIARLNQQTTFDIFPLRFFLIGSFALLWMLTKALRISSLGWGRHHGGETSQTVGCSADPPRG